MLRHGTRDDLRRIEVLVRTAKDMACGIVPERQGHIQAGQEIFHGPATRSAKSDSPDFSQT
jgi:hypothetical protein